MEIDFSDTELQSQKLEVTHLDISYLMAICYKDPEVWKQFKNLILLVEKKLKGKIDLN